jgi:7-cyano-7-deazaguanine synthase
MGEDTIVLLSGGLDSTTALAWGISRGFKPLALTFSYGQRHNLEIEFARRIAEHYRVPQEIIPLPSVLFQGSALTDRTIPVPEEAEPGIPITYVPARNLVFLALASALAESRGVTRILLGANAVDFSGYPDCRREFFDAFEETVTRGTKIGTHRRWEILTPLIHMKKVEIIRLGLELGVPYEWTTSCYNPGSLGVPCLRCDACRFRQQGFTEAGIRDPLLRRLKEEGKILEEFPS